MRSSLSEVLGRAAAAVRALLSRPDVHRAAHLALVSIGGVVSAVGVWRRWVGQRLPVGPDDKAVVVHHICG